MKMDSLNLTPEQIANKIKREKPVEMDILAVLTSFSGRIGRKQFLIWYIPIWVLSLVLAMYDILVAGYYSLIMAWPLFALTTKRCHDLGSAGWFGLFQLIPGFGGILIILAGCGMTIGEFNDNRFGKSIYKK